ncbi:DUF1127 domain-containing protein [Lelliottia aquatilis]|uniref:DUF1127 domain-containing protein n=1 Tax=Lelliottia aquatilis TaxID=2080838 RepID=UPI00192AB107|nr:DUF1127 domain-containing protein [Lelliottia aquatilis]MBL5883671.1 DUF1127 domain-containing protein [Lelliottia aquatilis]
MEFNENRPFRPFIGFVLVWQAFVKWRRREQTRRLLQGMSDEQLRDVGLTRNDAGNI